MEKNLLFEKVKKIFFKYNKLIFVFFLMLLFIFLFSFFNYSFSKREDVSFDEIQRDLREIYMKDEKLYNKINVEIIKGISKGIDVSSWQGEIDWDKVKKDGIDFAMIRCGFRNLSNDEIVEDLFFKKNIEGALNAGLDVGVYFYSTAISEEEVLKEASFVLNLINDYEIVYPIAYDFEIFDKYRASGISDMIINNNAKTFMDYMISHGYKTILYTNLNNINYHWFSHILSDYQLWYAQYADIVNTYTDYIMWQYADNGRVDGIKGYVDLNESYYLYRKID